MIKIDTEFKFDTGFNCTVVNRVLPCLNWGSNEIMITAPLKECILWCSSGHCSLGKRSLQIELLKNIIIFWYFIQEFVSLDIIEFKHFCSSQYLFIKRTYDWKHVRIENRIYIRGEFTRKKCKTAILLYCFHTAGVLHIFMLYNLLGPGISFYRKSKINIKREPNYEIDWFHNWPMIISHYKRHDFPL